MTVTTTPDELALLSVTRRWTVSGEALRLRQAAGLSQAEVAGACGVTAAAVCRWERGERLPRGEAARKYAAVLAALARAELVGADRVR